MCPGSSVVLTPARWLLRFSRLWEQRGRKPTLGLSSTEEEDSIETMPSKCLQAHEVDLKTLGWAASVFHTAALSRRTVTN